MSTPSKSAVAPATVVELPASSPAYSEGTAGAGTAFKKLTSSQFKSFLGKPYNLALSSWILLFFLQWMGIGIPLWVLYLCAIPFCIAVILTYFINYKAALRNPLARPGLGFETLSNISPVFFLMIQLALLVYIFVSNESIIETNSIIPENFNYFKGLVNLFLFGQALLILHYLKNPDDIKKLGLWFIMACTITASLACMHYMWIILTKLITDG